MFKVLVGCRGTIGKERGDSDNQNDNNRRTPGELILLLLSIVSYFL
jgi:hypothetical protein